jgi:hypothetical protein
MSGVAGCAGMICTAFRIDRLYFVYNLGEGMFAPATYEQYRSETNHGGRKIIGGDVHDDIV